jgi:hypothetical protein
MEVEINSVGEVGRRGMGNGLAEVRTFAEGKCWQNGVDRRGSQQKGGGIDKELGVGIHGVKGVDRMGDTGG